MAKHQFSGWYFRVLVDFNHPRTQSGEAGNLEKKTMPQYEAILICLQKDLTRKDVAPSLIFIYAKRYNVAFVINFHFPVPNRSRPDID